LLTLKQSKTRLRCGKLLALGLLLGFRFSPVRGGFGRLKPKQKFSTDGSILPSSYRNTDTQPWIRWLHVEKISLGVFSVILWILPPVFTASFLHTDPPLSPLGSDLLNSFLKSILVPRAIVLLYNMVLTIISKSTFLPWSLFDYLSYY